MPYYLEAFANQGDASRQGSGPNRLNITDSARVLSFRTRPHPSAIASYEVVNPATVDPYAYFLASTTRKQYNEAMSARGMKGFGRPDHGHPFEVVRHQRYGRVPSLLYGGQEVVDALPAAYGQGRLNNVHNGDPNTLPTWSDEPLGAFAQQAYARAAPSSVQFDAARFLGELRAGLPRMGLLSAIPGQSRFFKKLGSDYLNVEFGWKPFIDDLVNAGKALSSATHQLSNQGQRVHRRYGAPATTSSGSEERGSSAVSFQAGGGFPAGFFQSPLFIPKKVMDYDTPLWNSSFAHNFGRVEITKSVQQRRWFEGEFTALMPLGFDPTNYFDRLNQLVNLKLTPSVLWELAPWSWLVDWALRIGDTIRANELRANDLLIMHYGYAMEHTVYNTGLRASLPRAATGMKFPERINSFTVTTRKRRIRANPYGFRLGGQSSLTEGQSLILGALGLTKAF